LPAKAKEEGQKMAEIRRLLLGNRTFFGDDLPCEWHALAATRAAAQRRIGTAGIVRAPADRRADILFPNRITDADDHMIRSPERLDMATEINSQ
jgi:hypothetical protein